MSATEKSLKDTVLNLQARVKNIEGYINQLLIANDELKKAIGDINAKLEQTTATVSTAHSPYLSLSPERGYKLQVNTGPIDVNQIMNANKGTFRG